MADFLKDCQEFSCCYQNIFDLIA